MKRVDIIRARIMDLPALQRQLQIWRFCGNTIAFTNGCFDLLHPGHVAILAQAADLADKLVVGINSDESVKKLKGELRPIVSEEARCIIIASLLLSGAVVLFNENTPLNLIKVIKPDILVKGEEYEEKDIVGYDFVKSYGGEVVRVKMVNGYSTSSVEDKVLKLHGVKKV